MSTSSKLYTMIVPEKPLALANERIFVYVPVVQDGVAGIAKFDTTQFNIDLGEVSIQNLYELLDNKATDFTTKDHTKYPTVLAAYNEMVAQITAHNSSGSSHADIRQALVDQIAAIVNGDTIADKATKDAAGNVITSHYETKADAITHKSRTTVLETFKNVTVPATYETQENATAQRLTKVDKVLSAYDLATLSDSQRLYIDSSGTPKFITVGALRTFIASDFVSFGYVIPPVVDENGLPVVDEPLTNKIYLVAVNGEDEENNTHNEFIYVDGNWEMLGTTQLNLDDIILSNDVTSDGDVGFIAQNQTIPSGTTFQQFVELLLKQVYETQYPTLNAPSVNLSSTTGIWIESGTVENIDLEATFNAGSIMGDLVEGVWNTGVKQDDRAGAITSYEIGVLGSEVDIGTTNTRTIDDYEYQDGNNVFNVIANHAEGVQPYDSDEENYSSPLSAGEVTKTLTIQGVRKLFYGVDNDGLDSEDIRALSNSTLNPSNGTTFTISVPIGSTSVVFAYPATLRTVSSINQVGVGDAKAQFTETEVDVRSALDDVSSEIAYKVFIFEPAEAYLTEESYEVTI